MWSMPLRKCRACGIRFPSTIEYFALSTSREDGLRHICRECNHRQRRLRRYMQLGFIVPRYKRQWNKGKASIRILAYDFNRGHKKALRARPPISRPKSDIPYQKRYPEKYRAYTSNRRARKLAAGGSYTDQDVQLQICAQTDAKGKLRCWWCDKIIKGKYHVDHRVPLSKGGTNDPRNIVIAHIKCNLRKNDRMPWDYNGRLL